MQPEDFTTRLAKAIDVGTIVDLSSRVQTALTASGSLQEIGPLAEVAVSNAIDEQRCLVVKNACEQVLGCAFIRSIEEDYFPYSSDFNILSYPRPWLYLYSIMLSPEMQGRGIGLKLLGDVVQRVQPTEGTILLDCWAGNDKLRTFYARAGCKFVAVLPEHDYEIAVFVRILSKDVENQI